MEASDIISGQRSDTSKCPDVGVFTEYAHVRVKSDNAFPCRVIVGEYYIIVQFVPVMIVTQHLS